MELITCRFPINGPVEISQGWNGPWSHFKKGRLDLQLAVDLRVPFGTPILAARDGTVLSFFDEWKDFYPGWDLQTGLNQRTNHLIITCPDGTLCLYSHFQKNSVVKAIGDKVNQGDIIGTSGRSGWLPTPHIHFQVMQSTRDMRTLPFSFENYSGPLEHQELVRRRLIR